MPVSYAPADDAYLGKRRLRRHARVLSLWAMGVGAVISGDFFGWNYGMASGGFGGMLLAVAVMTVMYAGLCFSIAEMSPALPHAGGAYSFARTSMGLWGGYITGLAENMEYILTPAVIVVGIGGYLTVIFGTPAAWEPLWWLLCYGLFVALNVWGVEMSFQVSVLVTLMALAVLAVFWVGAAPRLEIARWASPYFPVGANRAGAGLVELPFALWLYLGIEQLPLAAEESHDPRRDMPRGILSGLVTLIVVSFLTVILSAGMAPGAAKVAASSEPLFLGFQTIFGAGLRSRALALAAVAGLIASFHTIIYAYGRQIYSLSRAGYFPTWLSVTHGKRETPHRALLAGAALGYMVALTVRLLPQGSPAGAVLLNMAVFGAVLAYILQMASFILLRLRFPHIPRPYVSPVGVAGAAFAGAVAMATLVVLFLNADYNKGVIGAAVWFVLGIAYYALYARRRLVLAPEEQAALKYRKHTCYDPNSVENTGLRSAVEAQRWAHRIDLGDGIVTPGLFDNQRTLDRLRLPASLAGQTVLDVGCWDGFYSFEAERRGAARVLATDSFVWRAGHRDAFLLARRTLRSNVEDREIDVLELTPDEVGTFDVVLFLGVLYHMKHPMLALEHVASITKRLLVVETVIDLLYLPGKALRFYPGAELDGDDTNWFGPTPSALEAMLRLAEFRRVERVWPSGWRLALWRVLSLLGSKAIKRAVYHAYRE